MTIRILHVITSTNRGGAESMLARLVTHMDRAAFEHRVVCLGKEGVVANDLRDAGIPTECLDLKKHPLTLFRWLKATGDQGHGWHPHILQGWMYHGNLAAMVISKRLPGRIPLVWNIRTSLDKISTYKTSTRFAIRMGARLSSRADRVLFNSMAARNQHEAIGYCSARSLWIPNGFDLKAFRPNPDAHPSVLAELGLPSETKLIGQFARLHPEKNQELLIQALESLPGDVHLLLAGQGIHPEQPQLRALMAHSTAASRIHLLGERNDIPRLTAALDIAASPSWNEGFSNALGEALACGVPCVGTAVGDTALLIDLAGRVVPPGDPMALAGGITELLRLSRIEREELGRLGRQHMESDFQIELIAEKYGTLYKSLK